jgi:hypothetical protein
MLRGAARDDVGGGGSADFYVVICPSGALAGVIDQIKQQLPGGGADVELTLFDVACRLFVAWRRSRPGTLESLRLFG